MSEEKSTKDEILEILKANVKLELDLDGLVLDVIEKVALEALEKVVADSSNPFDDVAYAALKEPLKAQLKKLLQKAEDKLEEAAGGLVDGGEDA